MLAIFGEQVGRKLVDRDDDHQLGLEFRLRNGLSGSRRASQEGGAEGEQDGEADKGGDSCSKWTKLL
jgi:hypothetical protein